jgi:hypothetical protein
MQPDEQGRIRTYLSSKLKEFAESVCVNPELNLADLDKSQAYKDLADKVNSGLLEGFDCLEDYKIITVVSALNPDQKGGGLSTAAVWSTERDLVISTEYRIQTHLFSVSSHFVRMPDSDDESD